MKHPTPSSLATAQSLSPSPSFSPANIKLQSQDATSTRTIPQLVEHNATRNPHHSFCIQAQKQGHSQHAAPELLSISHLQLKRAIVQCQAGLVALLRESKLPSGADADGKSPPVALYVESDVGLLIYLFSLMGLGIPVRLHPRESMGCIV